MDTDRRLQRRSIDALDAVKERQASIEAARLALARSEARVKSVTAVLARTTVVLHRLKLLQQRPWRGLLPPE